MTSNGWPAIDALHPAGHARDATPARSRTAARVQAERLTEGDDREGVVGVEAAGEAQVDATGPPGGAVELEVEAGAVLRDARWRGRRPPAPCRT